MEMTKIDKLLESKSEDDHKIAIELFRSNKLERFIWGTLELILSVPACLFIFPLIFCIIGVCVKDDLNSRKVLILSYRDLSFVKERNKVGGFLITQEGRFLISPLSWLVFMTDHKLKEWKLK